MRIITMLSGLLMIGTGIFLVANGGITFLSVAFIVGIIFVVCGLVECLSYNSYRGDSQDRTWILIDGTTTLVLGCLILLDKLSADAVVPMVLGLWVLITGIRNFVRAWERLEIRDNTFYEHLIIGALNLIFGIYVFFDRDVFNLAAITIIGACILVQGLNLLLVGGTIVIKKPEFIKTKHEKLEELQENAEKAHLAAKEAIRLAKEAKQELKDVQAMPEEIFDIMLQKAPEVNITGSITEMGQSLNAAEPADEAGDLSDDVQIASSDDGQLKMAIVSEIEEQEEGVTRKTIEFDVIDLYEKEE